MTHSLRSRFAFIAVAVSAVFALSANARAETPTPSVEKAAAHAASLAEIKEILAVRPDDWAVGKDVAPVTIVEYASLSCPHCAEFYTTIYPKVKEQYIDTGKVRFVYRHFPLNVTALKGGALSICAGKERFHDFLKVLFGQQEKWAFSPDFDAPLSTIASVGGFTRAQYDACLNDEAIEKRLIASRKEASEKLGVESTPTFFINGKKVVGEKGFKDFESLIDLALKETKSAPAP